MRSHAERRFGQVTTFNQYRGLLFSIAYRMVGTVDRRRRPAPGIVHPLAAGRRQRDPIAKAFLITNRQSPMHHHLQSARVQREEIRGRMAA